MARRTAAVLLAAALIGVAAPALAGPSPMIPDFGRTTPDSNDICECAPGENEGVRYLKEKSAADEFVACDEFAKKCGTDAECHSRAATCFAAVEAPAARHLAFAHSAACRGLNSGDSAAAKKCPWVDVSDIGEGELHPMAARRLQFDFMNFDCDSFEDLPGSDGRGTGNPANGGIIDEYENRGVYNPKLDGPYSASGVHDFLYYGSDDEYCVIEFGDPTGRYGVAMHMAAVLKGSHGYYDDDNYEYEGANVAIYRVDYQTGERTRISFHSKGEDGSFIEDRFTASPGEFLQVIGYADDGSDLAMYGFVELCTCSPPDNDSECEKPIEDMFVIDDVGLVSTRCDNPPCGSPDLVLDGVGYYVLDGTHGERNMEVCGDRPEPKDEPEIA